MKFPLRIIDADGVPVPDPAPYNSVSELVRRANAFDELLAALKEADEHLPFDWTSPLTTAALAKYEVPGSEP